MRSGKSPLESQTRYANKTDLVVTKCLICYDFFKENQWNVGCYLLGITAGRCSDAGWLQGAHNCLMNCNSEDCYLWTAEPFRGNKLITFYIAATLKSFTRGITHKSNPIYISISPVHTHACLYTLIQRMDAWVRQPALEAGSSSVVTCGWVSPGKSRRAGICFIPPCPSSHGVTRTAALTRVRVCRKGAARGWARQLKPSHARAIVPVPSPTGPRRAPLPLGSPGGVRSAPRVQAVLTVASCPLSSRGAARCSVSPPPSWTRFLPLAHSFRSRTLLQTPVRLRSLFLLQPDPSPRRQPLRVSLCFRRSCSRRCRILPTPATSRCLPPPPLSPPSPPSPGASPAAGSPAFRFR